MVQNIPKYMGVNVCLKHRNKIGFEEYIDHTISLNSLIEEQNIIRPIHIYLFSKRQRTITYYSYKNRAKNDKNFFFEIPPALFFLQTNEIQSREIKKKFG